MAKKTTIQEEFLLPSRGLLYGKPFDPTVKLRSMTVTEEMKRLAPSINPYKSMSEIIEDCLVTKLPISVYDLCLGDYTFLLHKLRIVTYGPEYNVQFACPKCGNVEKIKFNLDELKVNLIKDEKELDKLRTVTLPSNGSVVKLRFQTPRDLDNIQLKAKDMKENFPEMEGDPTLLLTLQSLIESVNGEPLSPITGLEELKKLPMMDTNVIAQTATKLNEKVGIDTAITLHCPNCGNDVNSQFRFTSEFFGPSID